MNPSRKQLWLWGPIRVYIKYILVLFLLFIPIPTFAAPSFTLTWTDNSNNEDGFKIERKIGAGTYSQIGTTLTNISTFQDTSLTLDIPLCYRVRAYNLAGDSGYSNEACRQYPSTAPTPPTNIIITVP